MKYSLAKYQSEKLFYIILILHLFHENETNFDEVILESE